MLLEYMNRRSLGYEKILNVKFSEYSLHSLPPMMILSFQIDISPYSKPLSRRIA